MKTFRLALSFAAASIVAVASASAQTNLHPVTNWTTGTSQLDQFNSNAGYGPSGASLDGAPTTAPVADQWKTTDPYNGGTGLGSTSLMAFTPGWTALTAGTGNQSVLFGGYDLAGGILPGINNPSLYRTFNSLLVTNTEKVSFITDFGIVGDSFSVDPAYPNNDVFGFSFANLAGTTNLASVQFTNNAGSLKVLANGGIVGDWSYNSLYRLTATFSNSTFSLDLAGLVPQTNGLGVVTNYSVFASSNYVAGAAILGGLTAKDFEYASINWELTGGTNAPGANYMIVNSAQVVSQVIPEPGTWATAALLLGGAVLVVRRRRAAAAQA